MPATRLLPALALAAGLTAVACAQEPAGNKVTLRWYGQSFFQLETTLGRKVVWDPHAIPEFGRPVVQADVILLSHLHDDHTQTGVIETAKSARVFNGLEARKGARTPDWKKVDEKVGQVRVRSVGTYHDADEGMSRGKNTIWVVEADGLTFCHLGDLGHELSAAQVKAIGKVDVLMVPVGGVYTINGGQAKRVVDQLKPRLYVLPMHYGVPGYDDLQPATEFLDGQPRVKRAADTNELVIPTDAQAADGPTVVLLGWSKDPVPKK